MSAQPSVREQQARVIFSSAPAGDPADLLALALALRDEENNIEYARRVLEVARQLLDGASFDLRFEVLRALIVSTYKSPDQPLDRRLNNAAALARELLPEERTTQNAARSCSAFLARLPKCVGVHLDCEISWKHPWRSTSRA